MTEFAPQLKLLHHRDSLRAFIGGDWKAPPVQVEISPTNHCQARCDWCFYVSSEYKQKHSREEIEVGTLCAAISTMSDMGVKAISWTGGGDPSAYTGINSAIGWASSCGLRQGIFTNGYGKIGEPQLLDWIRITVTEKFVLTKNVADYVKHTKVGVNFNLCEENFDKLTGMVKQAKDMGVHYFQVRPALADNAGLQKFIECPDWLKDYGTEEFRIVLTDYKWDDYMNPHGYPKCHGHRMVPFIWHNGDVSTCAYHFGREPFTMGNLNQDSFRAIWEGDRRRQMCLDGVDVIPECQHCCKLHEINKTLAVINGDVNPAEDLNFL